MALVDPVKVYAATSNVEAQMIGRLLQSAGIEAHAGEDVSPAGIWVGGTIAGVFDAGVFVSRSDGERAVEVIRQHERQEAARAAPAPAAIEATCEECGATTTFPASQNGTVQNCPRCGAFMDVGESELEADVDEGITTEPRAYDEEG